MVLLDSLREIRAYELSSSSSYTPLILAIQEMLEYDNNNRLPETRVRPSRSSLSLLHPLVVSFSYVIVNVTNSKKVSLQ